MNPNDALNNDGVIKLSEFCGLGAKAIEKSILVLILWNGVYDNQQPHSPVM